MGILHRCMTEDTRRGWMQKMTLKNIYLKINGTAEVESLTSFLKVLSEFNSWEDDQ